MRYHWFNDMMVHFELCAHDGSPLYYLAIFNVLDYVFDAQV
jgi:hypothetical protein